VFEISTEDLIFWIKNTAIDSDDKESLYLLLDLIGGISKKDINYLKFSPEKTILIREKLNTLKNIWEKHKYESVPIQYLARNTYWRNFKFFISNEVLIPRVETEQIVDIVHELFKDRKEMLFVDLGTGSGAIAIAIASMFPDWNGIATDINQCALRLAKQNFKKFSCRSNLKFYRGNWLIPLRKIAGEIDLLIANPPYIPKYFYERLPLSVKNYEPKVALYGGIDGLLHISQIISDAPSFLKKGGWLVMEHHFDQGHKVKNLMVKNGFDSIRIIKDFFGIGRFTIGKYN
tara:strand:- start:766 stop:1632 length:867 start_codon:yes stop_codon:yes gene_type:complete